MDALELLISDHEKVRALFEQFKSAKEADDTERLGQLQREIFTELEVHTGIEEDVFYPEAKEAGEEAQELVNELTPDDAAWKAKMTVLIENVEHHADEEEEEMFPQLREVFGDERLQRMGEQLAEAKERRMSAAGSSDLTRDELYDKAKEQDVEGRSTMSKDELAEAVEES